MFMAETWDQVENISASIIGPVHKKQSPQDLYWRDKARDALTLLVFASNLGGYTMRDVARWAGAFNLNEVATILNEGQRSDDTDRARMVLETMQATPLDEQRTIFSLIQAALRA